MQDAPTVTLPARPDYVVAWGALALFPIIGAFVALSPGRVRVPSAHPNPRSVPWGPWIEGNVLVRTC